MDKDNAIYAYYQRIREGSVVVGKWIEIIYTYLVNGLEQKLFFFDQKKASAAINWIEEHCFHVEGVLAPSNFKLELWQKALISAIFGIVDDQGLRQWREILLLIARKNGKSLLASGICDYVFRVEGGYGTKIFCLAPKLEQANIVYTNMWQMITLDPEWQEEEELLKEKDEHNKRIHDPSQHAMKHPSEISITGTNSSVKKIAFSAKKSDGFNPSLTVCDEIASWAGDAGLKQYEVMKSAMGARPEGLIMSFTTSGYVNDSIFDELMKRSTRFLLGESKEKRLLPLLYMIDDPQKWNDINELRKSNPNLGISVSVDYMLEEIAVAEQSLSKKTEFMTKYCCVKQNSSLAWLNTQDVEKAFSGLALNIEDFRRCYCVAGVDLSQTTDLTAALLLIEKKGKIYVFAHFWMPSEKVDEATARDGLPYRAYIQKGFLSPSGDNFVDYKDCYNWLVGMVEQYNLYPLKVGYDRYSAAYLTQDLKAYGFQCDWVLQGENLTPVINEVDGKIKDGAFECGNNDLLKVHWLNAALKINAETNRKKLVKISALNRIDGMAAFLDAMCMRAKWASEIGEQLKNSKR